MTPEQLSLLQELNSYIQTNHNKCWCIPWEEGNFLHFLVAITKPGYILEIGTSIGFSTIWLAIAAAEYGGVVKTIEIHDGRAAIAKENFKKAKLNNITTLQGEATALIKEFEPFDFIFLDAGKEHYLDYLTSLERNTCIKKGTIIVADNAKIIPEKKNEQLLAYLHYVRTKYVSSYIPFENGMELSVKAVHSKAPSKNY